MILIVVLLIGFPTIKNIIPQGRNCSIKLHYLRKRQSALPLLRQQRTPGWPLLQGLSSQMGVLEGRGLPGTTIPKKKLSGTGSKVERPSGERGYEVCLSLD